MWWSCSQICHCAVFACDYLCHRPSICCSPIIIIIIISMLCCVYQNCSVSVLHLFLLPSPAMSLGFTILGEMRPFFNPAINVDIFCLHGWCVLSVFLLLAFTHLGHERQDLLSPCHGMHVCTDETLVYTLIRKRMESDPMLTPREKLPLPEKSSSEEDRIHNTASCRTASPTHSQLSYSGPPPSSADSDVNYDSEDPVWDFVSSTHFTSNWLQLALWHENSCGSRSMPESHTSWFIQIAFLFCAILAQGVNQCRSLYVCCLVVCIAVCIH